MEEASSPLNAEDIRSLRDFEQFDLSLTIPKFLRQFALIDPQGFLEVLEESDAPRRITYTLQAKMITNAPLESMQQEMRLVFLKALRICNATTHTDFSGGTIQADAEGLTPYERLAKLNQELEAFNDSGVFDVRKVVGDTNQLDFE